MTEVVEILTSEEFYAAQMELSAQDNGGNTHLAVTNIT
jgi:hypothetical protein